MEIKVKNKKLEIGKKYKITWKGIYNQKHEYIGYLTKLEGEELIFNDDLYLYPKEIVEIEETNEQETNLSGFTSEEIKKSNKKTWWNEILNIKKIR